jgi:hypothetical protein
MSMTLGPAGRAPSRSRALLPELRVAAVLLASGLLLGAVWAYAAPDVARGADLGEGRVAVDGLLALLGTGAGVVTALVLFAVPGPRPAVRLAVVLGGATAAGLLAALVGLSSGLRIGAPGVALLWPLVTAVVTALRTLAGIVVSPNGDLPRPARRHAEVSARSEP